MCELETVEFVCAHRFIDDILCDEVLFDCERDLGDCGKVVKTKLIKPHYCSENCVYRRWRKRWVCHRCHGPNKKTPRCAFNKCGHTVCHKCKPLTCPKKENATKVKYNALKHIKWSKTAKASHPLPRIPVYNSSVGDWV